MKVLLACFCFFVSIIALSCTTGPCDDTLDALPLSPYLSFRVVSATDSSDLLFGANRRFDPRSVELKYRSGGVVSAIPLQTFRSSSARYDSVLLATLDPAVDSAWLQLEAGDSTRLDFEYRKFKGCGGTGHELTSLRIEGQRAIIYEPVVIRR